MSQKHIIRRPEKRETAKLSATLNNLLVIRLVIACVIFAVSLIINIPDFLTTVLLVIAAGIAGYDIILSAVKEVESGRFLSTPVILVLIAVIAFFIGFPIEGAALVLLYQIGMILLNFAKEHTKKVALELLQDQDDSVIEHMRSIMADDANVEMSIQRVMEGSAGSILKLAMIFAIVYAIALPIMTSLGFGISIHRALIILLIATPLSVVVSIPIAAIVGICDCAKNGIVFGNAYSMEAMADANVAVFDKNGVFTDDSPRVLSMRSDLMDQDTFLNFVAHAVYYSEQPIANAVSAIFDQEYKLDVIKDFRDIPGYGVELSINGIPVLLAMRDLVISRGVDVPEEEAHDGQIYYMVVAERIVGRVVISADVNQDLDDLVPELKSAGFSRCVLLSEDSKEAGQQFAEMLNFSEMYPQCDTGRKLRVISDIAKKTKGAVLFVYSNSIETHSDAAVDLRVSNRAKYADAIIQPNAIWSLTKVKQISKRVREIVIENALFAFIVKAILIFLSMIGYCNLWFAIFLEFATAVAVVLNCIRVTSESLRKNLKYKMGR